MYGKYFFSDYCSGIIRVLYMEGALPKEKNVLDGADFAHTSFGEDYHHELYINNISNGLIYRVTDGSAQKNYAGTKPAAVDLLIVSPNPSNGNFVVTYNSAKTQQINISIQNLVGQQFYKGVKPMNAGMNTWKMNLHLPVGDYYIRLADASGKIINQRLRIE
jgi:hypothetical protein